jgi:hypothetical protein
MPEVIPAYLQGLSKERLVKELRRLQPYEAFDEELSKTGLAEKFKESLLAERTGEGPAKDLRGLMLKLKRGQVSIQEITSVMAKVGDPYKISQADMNFILVSNQEIFSTIIPVVESKLAQMTVLQMLQIISAIDNLDSTYGIEVPNKDEFFLKVMTRFHELADGVTLSQAARTLSVTQSLAGTPEYGKLQWLLFQRFDESALALSDSDKLAILLHLPTFSTAQRAPLVKAIVDSLLSVKHQFHPQTVIDLIFALHRIGYSIPFTIVNQLDQLPRELLRKISLTSLSSLISILSEQHKLTENFAGAVCDLLSSLNLTDTKGLAFIADFFYKVNEFKMFNVIANRQPLITRCLYIEDRLDLPSLLKIAIVYFPHFNSEVVANKLSAELAKATLVALQEHKDLLEQVMESMLVASEEKPIYDYQLLSFKVLSSSTRIAIGDKIASVLSKLSPCGALLKYYGSNLFLGSLPSQFKSWGMNLRAPLVPAYTQALWLHSDEFSSKSLVELGNSLVRKHDIADITLFYLSCFLEYPGKIPLEILPEYEALKNRTRTLISEQYDSRTHLATLYNLKATGEELTEVLKAVNVKAMHGEILIKSGLMLAQIGFPEAMADLSKNLRYWPKAHRKLASSLMAELVKAMHEASLYPLDLVSYSYLIANNITQLPPDAQTLAIAQLQYIVSDLPPETVKVLKPYLDALNEPKQQHSKADAKTQTKERVPHVDSLEAAIRRKVQSHELLSKYKTLLTRAFTDADILKVATDILNYLSIIGPVLPLLELLYIKMSQRGLWQVCEFELLVNYLYLHTSTPKTASALGKDVIDCFVARHSERSSAERLHENPKSKLLSYPQFIKRSSLEPRALVSNDASNREHVASLYHFAISPEELGLNLKLNAIFNILSLPKNEFFLTTIASYTAQRSRNPDLQSFKNSFIQLLSRKGGFLTGTKFSANFTDPITSWNPDLSFPNPKVAIMLGLEDEVVYNTEGEEVSISYLQKLISQQLEHIGGWRVFALKLRVWEDMQEINKQNLISVLHRELGI